MDENKTGLGQDLERDAGKIARAGADAASAAKAVGKAAAKAAVGDYVGAAAEAARSGLIRKTVALIVVFCLLLLIVIFYAAPLALYESVSQASETTASRWEQRVEEWRVDYYSGSSGRLASFFKALIGVGSDSELDSAIAGTTAGSEDEASSDDLQVFANEDAMTALYARKIEAVKNKLYARQKMVLDSINTGAIEGVMHSRFNNELAHKYDDDPYTRISYDGTEIAATARSISSRQALQVLNLYSMQVNSSIEEIKLSGLLKWMGYTANSGHTVNFTLGENSGIGSSITAWKGTFLPQYLVSEASQRDMLDEYRDAYGCSVSDLLIKVNCPNLYAVRPMESEEMVTESRTYTSTVWYRYKDYDDPIKPVYDLDGNILIMRGPYHKEWDSSIQRYVAVRNSGVPEVPYTIKYRIYHVSSTQDVTIKEIHVKYMVSVQVTARKTSDLVNMVGLWSGWLPSDIVTPAPVPEDIQEVPIE